MSTIALKPLTKEEQKKVLLLRKDGKPIKAIAKEMHISDKRVAAFLKGEKKIAKPQQKPSKKKVACECQSNCKDERPLTPEEELGCYLEVVGATSEEAAADFVGNSYKDLLDVLKKEVIEGTGKKSEKTLAKETTKLLGRKLDEFMKAVSHLCVATVLGMPVRMKMMFANSLFVDPKKAYEAYKRTMKKDKSSGKK